MNPSFSILNGVEDCPTPSYTCNDEAVTANVLVLMKQSVAAMEFVTMKINDFRVVESNVVH